MKIVDYNKNFNKNEIADLAYKICGNANFPVEYQDVYNHLFENDELILKLLFNNEDVLAGFGVFENYKIFFESKKISMLYLSGMVIDTKYQGHNISKEIIKKAYENIQSDLISLRTQNIAMAKSLINTFSDNLFELPRDINDKILGYLRQINPFKNINEYGVIEKCFPNQLYYNLDAIEKYFDIKLQSQDALGVLIEPKNKQKIKSLFK